jgi:tetratricopeptide (TPR) repeat protein
MIGLTEQNCERPTTSGAIAVVNLQAQIHGLTAPARSAVAQRALLADLLIQRGHVLGRIADYERAAELAEQTVRDAPDDARALLARARTRATLHRFAEALADLDAAGRSGFDRSTLDAERASILQAIGCYDQALALTRTAADRQPDFATVGALAALQAERGEVAEAEVLFSQAQSRYRGVSPFPLAALDFRRGLMWLHEANVLWCDEGNLIAARTWFDAAVRRVPGYAPALGHLAEVDAALGAHQAAIDRLRPLALSSDDPEYAGNLACVLTCAGETEEAERWRIKAAARYEELVRRHPQAFADHGAHFWLTVGGDPQRGRQLADSNLEDRRATRAYALSHDLTRAE